jgi:hypothetical protein
MNSQLTPLIEDLAILQTAVFSIELERRENRRIAVSGGAEFVEVFRMGRKRWMSDANPLSASLSVEGAVALERNGS